MPRCDGFHDLGAHSTGDALAVIDEILLDISEQLDAQAEAGRRLEELHEELLWLAERATATGSPVVPRQRSPASSAGEHREHRRTNALPC